jgi:hypothetical protein
MDKEKVRVRVLRREFSVQNANRQPAWRSSAASTILSLLAILASSVSLAYSLGLGRAASEDRVLSAAESDLFQTPFNL